MANPNIDVLGPPPSYDSVVYGSDGGSGVIQPGTNAPPPQYPTAPYTYPVAPSYGTYPDGVAQPQYPTTYNTSQAQHTTIVTANQPRPQTGMTGRRLMKAAFCLIFIPILVFLIFLFISRL